MATDTTTASATTGVASNRWIAGAVGGFIGSIPFGLMMMYVMPPPMLEVVVPALYGLDGLVAGWAIHQFHGVVLGVVYVGLVQLPPLKRPASEPSSAFVLAIGYGILTTIVFAVLVMPIWLATVGFPNAPPFPNVAIPGTIVSTIGHIVYAIPLALLYAVTGTTEG
ncbi:hypothetical protein SAMN05192561_1303 [Halopenitus malekzadehii]|uniref:Histidine kinase n=1 Tax=Halopenitus malekzadehii TaxID=1267564 RepID=A0A1H6K4D7_9EURY|nr:hypothetical protein [Halopenitus malekzadehii]SEH67787.1 hypothetical protein SAMN05192561_1303 [Halopenitus malekzadehii]